MFFDFLGVWELTRIRPLVSFFLVSGLVCADPTAHVVTLLFMH
jgi:hypothetical protein